ncbi:hypothetical protein C8E97_4251 [Saccharothrix australiensis]|uniref:Uncharacterized protein n=1 Tax=Saccharothrix australiensis TaxID=2072 RepID=A0A495W2F4_9PSEU|nr:hypothetical protein C8E97_4251 [Saccharothrix australiensis]
MQAESCVVVAGRAGEQRPDQGRFQDPAQARLVDRAARVDPPGEVVAQPAHCGVQALRQRFPRPRRPGGCGSRHAHRQAVLSPRPGTVRSCLSPRPAIADDRPTQRLARRGPADAALGCSVHRCTPAAPDAREATHMAKPHLRQAIVDAVRDIVIPARVHPAVDAIAARTMDRARAGDPTPAWPDVVSALYCWKAWWTGGAGDVGPCAGSARGGDGVRDCRYTPPRWAGKAVSRATTVSGSSGGPAPPACPAGTPPSRVGTG